MNKVVIHNMQVNKIDKNKLIKAKQYLTVDEISRARHVDRFNCCQVPLISGHLKAHT